MPDMILPMVFLPAGEDAAAANTATIQSLLSGSRLAQVMPLDGNGIIYVNDELVVRSGTILDAAGGTLRMRDDGASNILRNAMSGSVARAVTGTITSAALAGSGRFSVATVNCTGHGLVAGDFALVKGDANKVYNGVHQVFTVPNANSFTFLLPDGNHDVVPGASAGSLTVTKADAHIGIRDTFFDLNEVEGNSSGGNAGHGLIFNNVQDLQLQSVRMLRVNKYAIFGSNLWSPRFRQTYFDTGSDGFHFTGSVRDVLIDGVSGRTGDDVIAWTHAEAEYPLEGVTPDEVLGFTVRDMLMERSGSRGILLAPDTDTRMAGVKLTNIGVSRCVGALVLIDGPSGQGGTIEDVVVDGFYAGHATAGAKVIGIGDMQGTAVKSLTLKGGRLAPQDNALSGDLVRLANGSQVDSLNLIDIDVVLTTNSGDARALVYALGGSSIDQVSFSNCKTDGLGTNDTSYKWVRHSGDTTDIGRAIAMGGKISGNGQFGDHDSSISTTYVAMGGLTYDGFSSLLSGGKGFTAIIDGIVVEDAYAVLNLWGNGRTYNLMLRNIYNPNGETIVQPGTGNTINYLNGDVTGP